MNPTFSPADSLLSAPSECYSSLFDTESSPPCESVFTPRSMLDDDSEASSPLRITIETADEKKPAKKRKSWGQELPIPKTNLPPRKRAKTDDEKEQRRIERVLRNRAAAQSSRERKRLEVEGLAEAKADVERKFANLEARLREAEMQKMALREQVAQMAAQLTVLKQGGSVASSPTHSTASPTLSTDLYHSRQGDSALQIKLEHDISFDFSIPPPPQATVDPRDSRLSSPAASSSPCLDLPNATTPNSTQYPAASGDEPSPYREATAGKPLGPSPFHVYPHPAPISSPEFHGLFTPPHSVDGNLHFPQDGFLAFTGGAELDATFDISSMVDFDACQSFDDPAEPFSFHLDDLHEASHLHLLSQTDYSDHLAA
ncbi:MAG: hypothetical protein M1829_005861 [Trizodia sp. TS-e1964]|nr:MAG: hypothetical protein M1829_005861 [Trizodia sp. TS-e1964]